MSAKLEGTFVCNWSIQHQSGSKWIPSWIVLLRCSGPVPWNHAWFGCKHTLKCVLQKHLGPYADVPEWRQGRTESSFPPSCFWPSRSWLHSSAAISSEGEAKLGHVWQQRLWYFLLSEYRCVTDLADGGHTGPAPGSDWYRPGICQDWAFLYT